LSPPVGVCGRNNHFGDVPLLHQRGSEAALPFLSPLDFSLFLRDNVFGNAFAARFFLGVMSALARAQTRQGVFVFIAR